MIFDLNGCETALGYTFKNKMLLRQAFTHPSLTSSQGENYERLEFLGDSVLGYVVAEYLFKKYQGQQEGQMTEEKQRLVSTKPLSAATKNMGLQKYLLVGNGVAKTVLQSDSVCENLFEAVIAAIYLDGGIEKAKKFITDNLICKIDVSKKNGKKVVSPILKDENYKGQLQNYVQKNKLGDIEYTTLSKSGPDNSPTFEIQLKVGGKVLAKAKASKKTKAEQKCAETALKKINTSKKTEKKNGINKN